MRLSYPSNVKIINVRAGDALAVFIELRDVNYPGSSYQLTYDPAADRLRGTYFQAALRETYDVVFTRLKP